MRLLTVLFAATSFLISCSHSQKSSDGKYSGLGLESVSQEDLKTFAPPKPVPELKAQIEKLVDLRAPSAGVITNDGKTLFTEWNVTGSVQIWRLQGAKSFPVQLTGGEDRAKIAGLSPDNQWLVVHRDVKADENTGVYLIRAQNPGELQKVYYNSKHQASYQGFSKDSQSLYFRVNDKDPSSYAIYKYNVKTGTTDTIWSEPGIWSLSDIEGDTAILTKDNGSMQNEHFVLNLKTKKSEPLIGQGEKEDFTVALTGKAGEYLILTNKINDFRRLYIYKNKKLSEITPDFKADVDEFEISPDRKTLAFLVNSKGYNKAKIMDLRSKKISDLPVKGAFEQTYLGRFSENGKYLTVATEHHNEPLRSYVYSVSGQKLTRWSDTGTPELNTKNYIRAELLSYKAADGTDIPMFVWRTEKCKKEACPVIISFHGGPESQIIPRFSAIYNYYAENGFVFVTPNVRGSDGYGKKWLHADDGVNRLNVITDIRDAAEFIKKNWKVGDKVRKIGIMGGSYGGYSTLVGSSMFADSYDAGVAIVGMSSLITFIENTAPYRRALRMNEYGDPVKDREAMLKLSPVSYIDKVTKPLLIMHGATDPRVPVGEALQFYKKVQSQNDKDQLVIFPDEGHGVAKRPNVVLLHSYAIDFFKKNLN